MSSRLIKPVTLPVWYPLLREQVEAFIAGHEWTNAKTFQENPHSYHIFSDQTDFDAGMRFIATIHLYGRVRTFKERQYKYLPVGDLVYWAMCTMDRKIIINRKTVDKPLVGDKTTVE